MGFCLQLYIACAWLQQLVYHLENLPFSPANNYGMKIPTLKVNDFDARVHFRRWSLYSYFLVAVMLVSFLFFDTVYGIEHGESGLDYNHTRISISYWVDLLDL